jgi:LPXTG-site transpeptidase (sortase) family protein
MDGEELQNKSQSTRRQKIDWWVRQGILLTVAVMFLGIGTYGFVRRWRATHQTHTPESVSRVLSETVTVSTDEPDETPIREDNYEVAADMPRRIVMPSIDTAGYIQRVGVDQHQAIAVPNNVHLGGWFTGSVKPGETGLSIIDGHVQGNYAPGIFKQLEKIRTQDEFEVEFGDRSNKKFVVRSVRTVSAEEANTVLFEKDPAIERQLTLITCGGAFNKETQSYESRVIVVAAAL